jgi:hypothetical protein
MTLTGSVPALIIRYPGRILMLLRNAFVLAALSLAATPALADVHIAFMDEAGQPATQLYVKGGKVRIDGGRGFALYDVSSNSMTVFMPDKKQYLVFNQQSAAQIGAVAQNSQQQTQAATAQMQAAMAQHQGEIDQANQQMQAQMANMTPQMQAAMQKMMGNSTAGAAALSSPGQMKVEIKDLGTSETVAGHSCKDEQMVINGRPGAQLCVVSSPDSLGIPAADLATLKAMKDGMQKLMANMGPMAQGMADVMNKGFSIKTQKQKFDPKTMHMVSVTESLKSVTTESNAASLFELPAGYTQVTMDQMMGGAHP